MWKKYDDIPNSPGPVHYLALTVTNVRISVDFYSGLLGFKPIMEAGPRALLFNRSIVLAITSQPDVSQAPTDDRFNENRIGLDQRAISHGEIKGLGGDMPSMGRRCSIRMTSRSSSRTSLLLTLGFPI